MVVEIAGVDAEKPGATAGAAGGEGAADIVPRAAGGVGGTRVPGSERGFFEKAGVAQGTGVVAIGGVLAEPAQAHALAAADIG